ncbi:MAG TPA: hypothetical protein VFN44_21965 [Solirubrobacteraceae bacterium]|nr:hypothetical protein [Solirubrobacteraceae bacterium]
METDLETVVSAREAEDRQFIRPAGGGRLLFSKPRSVVARAWSALLAVWGGFIGLLPHVLHHVGPLAGAAVLAGTTGTVLFAAIGFVAAIPFLLRLHRRFRTWRAPAIALAIFAGMFSLSSFVIGPAIAGENEPAPRPGIEQPAGHDGHH